MPSVARLWGAAGEIVAEHLRFFLSVAIAIFDYKVSIARYIKKGKRTGQKGARNVRGI